MAFIYVLAGVNGAGKSSLGGAVIRASGADYFNPDEAARTLRERNFALGQREANSLAWRNGRELLERAIERNLDFAFETTLGASTIPRLLAEAADKGMEVRIWYAGLMTPDMHIARVKSRVAKGGHDIPEEDIRRRFRHSRLNLIALLPKLTALRMYDNSVDADPAAGAMPRPVLVLHVERGRIQNLPALRHCPAWAKPVAAAAIKLHSA